MPRNFSSNNQLDWIARDLALLLTSGTRASAVFHIERDKMTKMQGLGQIQKVALREAWPHESAEFTPWLAEHIAELGEALGLELELQSQEAPVGAFSLDLLAQETESSRTVIIENQLDQTDHNHLGKLLTYAGGYEANVVVWVAKDFRDEHRQALDWLNQRSNEDTEFFGVVVEVWRIDGSRPAPHFHTVVAPNEWRKETVRSARGRAMSDKRRQYQAFFQDLIDELRQRGFTNKRRGQPQNWISFSAGHGQRARYHVTFAQGDKVRVEVYIDNSNKGWNKELFDNLLAEKNGIESQLSESLEWERLDHARASRISVACHGTIDNDEESLKQLRDWMVKKLLAFQQVFGPKLEELATNLGTQLRQD